MYTNEKRWNITVLAVIVGVVAVLAGGNAVAAGPVMPASLGSYQRVSASAEFANGEYSGVFVDCPVGMRVLGGGVSSSGNSPNVAVTRSYPLSTTTWEAWVSNQSGMTVNVTTYAICGS